MGFARLGLIGAAGARVQAGDWYSEPASLDAADEGAVPLQAVLVAAPQGVVQGSDLTKYRYGVSR